MPNFLYAAVIQDHEEIPRFAKGLELHEVWLRGPMLNMPRGQGASRLREQLHRRIGKDTQLGLYAWHYLTHRSEDPLPGRGTRTLTIDATSGPCGHLQDTPACQSALEASTRALQELGGRTLVLATPSSMTPGSLGRRRLAGFFGRCQGLDIDLVWEPTGLWTPNDIGSVLSGTNAAAIIDESEHGDVSHESARVWMRVGGAGQAVHLSDAQAESLVIRLEASGVPLAHVVFAGPRAFANLRSFQRAVAELV